VPGASATESNENDVLRAAIGEAFVQGETIPPDPSGRYAIPSALNSAIAIAQMAAALAVLAVASRLSGLALAGAAVVFAFVMQVGFCLAHEAVHRKLHASRRVNLLLAISLFAFFPGSYHFFEMAHLVHHRRNRSDSELEDYVLEGEVAWTKRVIYYFLICGLFWLLVPLSSLAIALSPVRRISIPAPDEKAGTARGFTQFLNEIHPWRVRRDMLITACIWGAAIPLLHLTAPALAICYAFFGFSWASQQYIYHVRTPRHAVLGSLDLRMARPLELFYLHFNYHLTHHLAVWVPWIYLPRIAPVKPSRGYVATYVRLWKPPEPIERAWPPRFLSSGPIPPRATTPTGDE
jgi:fatty acid desaturase